MEIPGGTFAMGANGGGFAYDCERPRHARELAPFLIARDPVTEGAHLAFMADGGYARPELWTGEGWEWREREGARAPLHWERDGEGGWLVRRYDRREPVVPGRVLCHVSAHEADAHARWAGRAAAHGGRVGARRPGGERRHRLRQPRPARFRPVAGGRATAPPPAAAGR